MTIALDTNVLLYAEGLQGPERRDAAMAVIRRLQPELTFVPVQVLGELFSVLVRKGGKTRSEARDTLLSWRDSFSVLDTTAEVIHVAFELSTDHHLSIWDAIVIAASSRAGCRILLSEDMQHGFTWGGVTVVNPFASPRHPLLDAFLAESS